MNLKESLYKLVLEWAHTGCQIGVDPSHYDHEDIKSALAKAVFEEDTVRFPYAGYQSEPTYRSFAAFVHVMEGPESPAAKCLPHLWDPKDDLESAMRGAAWLLLAAYGKEWARAKEGQEGPLRRLLYTALINRHLKAEWINDPKEGQQQTNNLMFQHLLAASLDKSGNPRFKVTAHSSTVIEEA